MSIEKLDALIEELSDELQPIKPMAHPIARMFPLMLMSSLYVLAVIALLGVRGDWMLKLFQDMHCVFECSLALSISISAALALGWLSVPDMRGQAWVSAIPLTLTGVFIFWAALRMAGDWGHFELHLTHCALDGIFMLLFPMMLLVFVSRKGASTFPFLSAFMTVLSFSGLSWVGLRFTCGDDSFAHAFLVHFLPFIVTGILFGLFARKIFRW